MRAGSCWQRQTILSCKPWRNEVRGRLKEADRGPTHSRGHGSLLLSLERLNLNLHVALISLLSNLQQKTLDPDQSCRLQQVSLHTVQKADFSEVNEEEKQSRCWCFVVFGSISAHCSSESNWTFYQHQSASSGPNLTICCFPAVRFTACETCFPPDTPKIMTFYELIILFYKFWLYW